MITCSNCGVELEPDMEICPLCKQPTTAGEADNKEVSASGGKTSSVESPNNRMSRHQRKAVWELISIITIILIIATSLVNFIVNREVSWSEYPVAICLIIISYVSSFAFLNAKRALQLASAFVASSILIVVVDRLTGGLNWALRLGVPILFFANLVFIGLMAVIRSVNQRGINLIAFTFMAAAILCLAIEATLDLYFENQIQLFWSLIVGACVLLVSTVLLFMHYRMKKGQDLNKTFHI